MSNITATSRRRRSSVTIFQQQLAHNDREEKEVEAIPPTDMMWIRFMINYKHVSILELVLYI